MSTRISQGGSFQPTTVKGPGGPTASTTAAAAAPAPQQSRPQQPADAFVQGGARDFSKVLGQPQVSLQREAPAASQFDIPPDKGKDNEPGGDIFIHVPDAGSLGSDPSPGARSLDDLIL